MLILTVSEISERFKTGNREKIHKECMPFSLFCTLWLTLQKDSLYVFDWNGKTCIILRSADHGRLELLNKNHIKKEKRRKKEKENRWINLSKLNPLELVYFKTMGGNRQRKQPLANVQPNKKPIDISFACQSLNKYGEIYHNKAKSCHTQSSWGCIQRDVI